MLACSQKLQTTTFGWLSKAFSQFTTETVFSLRFRPRDVVGVYCALPFREMSEMHSSMRLGNSGLPTVTIVLMTWKSRSRRMGTRYRTALYSGDSESDMSCDVRGCLSYTFIFFSSFGTGEGESFAE